MFDFTHRRFNPLTGGWVLVSPHRTKRPWLGAVEDVSSEKMPAYDPKCYLCPGNERANGEINPAYESTVVIKYPQAIFPCLGMRVVPLKSQAVPYH